MCSGRLKEPQVAYHNVDGGKQVEIAIHKCLNGVSDDACSVWGRVTKPRFQEFTHNSWNDAVEARLDEGKGTVHEVSEVVEQLGVDLGDQVIPIKRRVYDTQACRLIVLQIRNEAVLGASCTVGL
jgi:hypothetical protein